jgi:hypothetical protein
MLEYGYTATLFIAHGQWEVYGLLSRLRNIAISGYWFIIQFIFFVYHLVDGCVLHWS